MKVEEKWNKFIELMIATKNAWETLCRSVVFSKYHWEKLPPRSQKVLAIANTKAKFEVAIPRLIDYWRGYGGLESLIIPVEEKKPKKESTENEKEQIAA